MQLLRVRRGEIVECRVEARAYGALKIGERDDVELARRHVRVELGRERLVDGVERPHERERDAERCAERPEGERPRLARRRRHRRAHGRRAGLCRHEHVEGGARGEDAAHVDRHAPLAERLDRERLERDERRPREPADGRHRGHDAVVELVLRDERDHEEQRVRGEADDRQRHTEEARVRAQAHLHAAGARAAERGVARVAVLDHEHGARRDGDQERDAEEHGRADLGHRRATFSHIARLGARPCARPGRARMAKARVSKRSRSTQATDGEPADDAAPTLHAEVEALEARPLPRRDAILDVLAGHGRPMHVRDRRAPRPADEPRAVAPGRARRPVVRRQRRRAPGSQIQARARSSSDTAPRSRASSA